MKSIRNLPYGGRWRELWRAKHINSTNLPSSIAGGAPMTLSNGACLGSTADGIHFMAGVATSNVKFADPYDAAGDWACSFRFKPDTDFSSASATDQYLLGKYVDATNYLVIYLRASDGKICFDHTEGGATEDVVTAETSWTAGTWYHILVSKSNTNTKQRIRINGGTAVEEANGTAISLVADICIGARDDGVSTEGFAGVITDVSMFNDTLSDAEEIALSRGDPPIDAINRFTFDEGRGTTATDRGSGADNGTLDSSCSWAFGGCKRPVLSLDGIDAKAVGTDTSDIRGALTFVWVGRIKAFNLTNLEIYLSAYGDSSNRIHLYQDNGAIIFAHVGGATVTTRSYSASLAIDDYVILIGVVGVSSLYLYENGVVKGSNTSTPGDIETDVAYYEIGALGGGNRGYGQALLAGIVDGELSASNARELSKWLNEQLDLGLSI